MKKGKKMDLLTVNLTQKNYRKLKAVSEEKQIPMTVIVRQSLEEWIKKHIDIR